MKFKILLVLSLLLNLFTSFQIKSQIYNWGFPLGYTNYNRVMDVNVDNQGNIVIAGFFEDSIDLDPSTNIELRKSNVNFFLAKYTSNGNYIWGFVLDSTLNTGANCLVQKIDIDDNNNIYVCGYLTNDTIDLDPGSGYYPLASSALTGFVAKYSSSGNLIWAFNLLGSSPTSLSRVNDINVSNDGNIVICGSFRYDVDIDPSSVSNYLYNNFWNGFVAKYTSSGNLIWGLNIGSTTFGEIESLSTIRTDDLNNVYVGGHMSGIFDADPGAGVHTIGYPNVSYSFLGKYTGLGNFVWSNAFQPSYTGVSNEEIKDIVVDSLYNVYAVGSFRGNTDFDPDINSVATLSSQNTCGFVAKYDSLGNYKWAFKLDGGINGSYVTSIDISPSLPTFPTFPTPANLIYITGTAGGPIDYDPGQGSYILQTVGSHDVFVAIYTSDSVLFCAYTISGDNPNFQLGRDIYVLDNGDYLVCGQFGGGTANFSPFGLPHYITATAAEDGFLVKYKLDTLASCNPFISSIQNNNLANDQIIISPNPNYGIFYINSNNFTKYELYNSLGILLKTGNEKRVDINNLPSGLYILKIDNQVKKILKL